MTNWTMTSFFRHRPVVNILRLIWVFVILFYEYVVFIESVRLCTWPDSPFSPSLPESAAIPETRSRPHHVLLVADPQLLDRHSYPNRFAPISYLTRLAVDLNMRKSWLVAIRKQPDTIVFLGDAMDSGRLDIPDDEYETLFDRFKSIFKVNNDIPVYYIPGNHDTGLGNIYSFKKSSKARERYSSHFGAPNKEVSIANHTLLFFDAPRFVDEDFQRHGQRMTVKGWRPIRGGSWEFLKNFPKQNHTDPVILFSHIPLYRPDGKNCGPLRERGTIRPGAGEGFQNTLEKQSTALVLDIFNPVAIFSGDDHDYCEYFHRIRPEGDGRTIREVSVRSISMDMNVRRPGFQLLSLAPAELRQSASKPSYVDKPCLLPDQIQIYLERYLPLLIMTVLVVFFSVVSGIGLSSATRSPTLLFAMKEDSSSDPEEEMCSPPRSASNSSSPKTFHPRNPRSIRGRGWAMFQAAATRRDPSPSSPFPNILHTLRTYCPRPASPLYLRRRRLWVRCIRDVRDIAIFPMVAFALVAWRVVSY